MASIKVVVFWNEATCWPAETDRRYRGTYCLYYQGDVHHPNDRGKYLWNVSQFLEDFGALSQKIGIFKTENVCQIIRSNDQVLNTKTEPVAAIFGVVS